MQRVNGRLFYFCFHHFQTKLGCNKSYILPSQGIYLNLCLIIYFTFKFITHSSIFLFTFFKGLRNLCHSFNSINHYIKYWFVLSTKQSTFKLVDSWRNSQNTCFILLPKEVLRASINILLFPRDRIIILPFSTLPIPSSKTILCTKRLCQQLISF